MSTTYILIKQLLHEKQWTGAELERQSGLSHSSLQTHLANPDRPLNSQVGRILRELHEREIKPALPNNIASLIENKDRFKEQATKSLFERHIDSIETSLYIILDKAMELDSYEEGGFLFVLATIWFERRFYLKATNSPSSEEIAEYFAKAREALFNSLGDCCPEDKSKKVQILAHKCNVTGFATEFMELDRYKRSRSIEVRAKLMKTDFFSSCRAIIEEQPYNWMAARNGLTGASVSQDGDNCSHFWDALKTAHKKFEDRDYSPKGMPSLNNDLDLWWFRDNY